MAKNKRRSAKSKPHPKDATSGNPENPVPASSQSSGTAQTQESEPLAPASVSMARKAEAMGREIMFLDYSLLERASTWNVMPIVSGLFYDVFPAFLLTALESNVLRGIGISRKVGTGIDKEYAFGVTLSEPDGSGITAYYDAWELLEGKIGDSKEFDATAFCKILIADIIPYLKEKGIEVRPGLLRLIEEKAGGAVKRPAVKKPGDDKFSALKKKIEGFVRQHQDLPPSGIKKKITPQVLQECGLNGWNTNEKSIERWIRAARKEQGLPLGPGRPPKKK